MGVLAWLSEIKTVMFWPQVIMGQSCSWKWVLLACFNISKLTYLSWVNDGDCRVRPTAFLVLHLDFDLVGEVIVVLPYHCVVVGILRLYLEVRREQSERLLGFLTSSSTTTLYRGGVPRLTSHNLYVLGRPWLLSQPVTIYRHRPNL